MRKENTMDSTEAPPLCGCCRRVPVSHLALDVSEPLVGWEAFFAAKGIQVASDHLGRPSVARYVLSDLLDEQQEREARLAEEAANAATLNQPVPVVGIPALEGSTAYETMMSAAGTSPVEEFGQWAKPRFLEEALAEGQSSVTAAAILLKEAKASRPTKMPSSAIDELVEKRRSLTDHGGTDQRGAAFQQDSSAQTSKRRRNPWTSV
jgi:hypothetical protein